MEIENNRSDMLSLSVLCFVLQLAVILGAVR